jgi:predicted esterase
MTRAFLAISVSAIALACWTPTGPDGAAAEGRLQARPAAPTVVIAPGEHRLGLTTTDRDATLYIPKNVASPRLVPLLLMLHGAGSSARNVRFVFPLAEELGIVVLAPDSRRSTWDGIGGLFGPDVAFIDAALRYTFQRVAVNPARVAIGGFSDGASYALSLGLANGDLFTHLIAFSPGFITPAPPSGRPPIFVSHGTADQILGIDVTSRLIVPRLRSAGYTVTYREFDGPHSVPAPIAREALEWLAR